MFCLYMNIWWPTQRKKVSKSSLLLFLEYHSHLNKRVPLFLNHSWLDWSSAYSVVFYIKNSTLSAELHEV